jgi:hypothetical protein
MTCDRCGRQDTASVTSWFNTETICMECSRKEREHPLFPAAKAAEEAACARGDFNFPGIGLPDDLRPRKENESC